MGPGGADRLDFEALETGLRRRMLEFGAQLAARRINQDHSDRVGLRPARGQLFSLSGMGRLANRKDT